MLFNSSAFLVFFPVVCTTYFLLPHRFRWLWLLLASCYFYMAFVPVYILILGFTIAVDYIAGILIEGSTGRRRRLFLLASIIANVGVLAVFKYWNFLNQNIGELFRAAGLSYGIPDLGILLPIGLSFHTFQSLSYTVEVYRGNLKAERHPGIFALFVMFFPQLVAGPIERGQALLHQFHERKRFSYAALEHGLVKIAYGFFKKVVVADGLAGYVNMVYDRPEGVSSIALLVGTVFFAVQIYCDFSGYSDIAIGTANILGIRLMENFRRPYLSSSISEFWSRWHISLSSWFRDYVYIPMGGNRVVKWRWYGNLMVTFMLSGLWHGANWTFIVWGFLHGSYLILALVLKAPARTLARAIRSDRLPGLRRAFDRSMTLVLVTLAWVFFRAADMDQALSVLGGIFRPDGDWSPASLALRGGMLVPLLGVGLILLLAASYRLPYDLRLRSPRVFLVLTTLTIILLGSNGGEFIYFQF
ncbi:MAG: MBOAT family protein [Flavobacteriales bacterium]|nr:MBOAT family protein [Flavobacteriales bacterium]MCB9167016.1 MBOAT family protein [Flavobacteriales bacterium]